MGTRAGWTSSTLLKRLNQVVYEITGTPMMDDQIIGGYSKLASEMSVADLGIMLERRIAREAMGGFSNHDEYVPDSLVTPPMEDEPVPPEDVDVEGE